MPKMGWLIFGWIKDLARTIMLRLTQGHEEIGMPFWDKIGKKAEKKDDDGTATSARTTTSGAMATGAGGGTGESGDERAWCVAGVEVHSLGQDRALLATDEGLGLAVPRLDAEFLMSCVHFAPLSAHARNIAAGFGLGQAAVESVRERLAAFAEQGLLVPWPRQADAAPSEDGAARIESVGLCCANRPDTARRALLGFIANALRYGHRPEWRIYDNSPDPATRMAYREMTSAVAAETGVRVDCISLEERDAFAKALAGEGIPLESAQFCLLGPKGSSPKGLGPEYGINHNAQLLDLAGKPGIGMDEDVVCRFARSPGFEPGAGLAVGDATEFPFFPDRE